VLERARVSARVWDALAFEAPAYLRAESPPASFAPLEREAEPEDEIDRLSERGAMRWPAAPISQPGGA
jgi:hypothetical protein